MQTRMYVAGIGSVVLVLTIAGTRLDAAPARAQTGPMKMEAEAAWLHPDRAEIVEQSTFPSKQGVSLKAGVTTNVGSPETQPDLVFKAKAPQAGRYWIRTHAATDAKGTEAMRQAASKTASLRLMISVGGSRPTKRVVFVPWSQPGSCTPATFALTLADRVVVLSKTGRLIEQSFPVNVPAGRSYQLLLAGLAPGNWSIRGQDGKFRFNARVEAGKNTAFVVAPGGSFTVQPETIPGAAEYQATPDFMPALATR